MTNKEFLFYYESRANPNGDPGFENQPRLMPDDTILVTDVRLKRTVRDYARDHFRDARIFVDYDEDGNAITADESAKRIIGGIDGKDVIKELILKTFDVPLFGALVTVRQRGTKEKGEGGSFKLTGTVQFGIARSVNKVRIINPTITSHFLGKEKQKGRSEGTEAQTYGAMGKFYAVEYALIKAYGAVTPKNLGKYYNDNESLKRFETNEGRFFECLWNGTNHLVTRSKYPQRSIFFLEVSYGSKLYNDLHLLVDESNDVKGWAKSLRPSPFIFTTLLNSLRMRKDNIEKVRVAHCTDLSDDSHKLVDDLKSSGLQTEDILCG